MIYSAFLVAALVFASILPAEVRYPALLVGAVVCARHAPQQERQPAFLLSVALAANWWLCGLAYEPYGVHRVLGLSAPEYWSVLDAGLAISGVAAAWHMRDGKWLGAAVWALSVCQILAHLIAGIMAVRGTPVPDYVHARVLTRCLEGMILCFFVIGGKNVADNIRDAGRGFGRWLRRVARPAQWVLAKVLAS